MLAQQVEAAQTHALERDDREWDDHPAPEIRELALVARDAELHLLDRGSGLLERLDRLAHDLRDARIDREDVEVGAVGDAHALDRAARRRQEVDVLVEAVGIARVVARERVQHERRVLDRPRQRPLVDVRVRVRPGVGPHDHRHSAERRLVAVDTRPRGRDADRAAAVGALGERHQPVRHGRRAAARRAAGVVRGVERIPGRTEEVVVGDAAEPHHRAVRLADQDRAGLLDALGEHAVGVDHEILERAHASERARPAGLEVEQVLHRRRHAVQRAQLLAGHDRALGLLGALARIVVALEHEGVEARVALLDALDDGVHDLDGRELPAPDASRHLRRRHVREIICERHRLQLPLGWLLV